MFYTRMNEAAMGEYFDEAEIQESIYNDFEEGALVAMAENESNYNKLIESIGMMESAMFDEEGTVVYTEGMISSVWESLKKFVIKVWQKIVALFKRFVAMFDQFFMKDKEFVKKYRVRVMKSDVKDLEFNGYTFKDLDNKSKTAGAVFIKHFGANLDAHTMSKVHATGAASDDIAGNIDLDKNKSDVIENLTDTYRGALVNKGKIDKDDFSDELKEYFYGSDSPESLDEKDMDLGTQLRIIESTHDDIKFINDLKKNIDRTFKAVLKLIDDKKGEAGKKAGEDAYNDAKDNKASEYAHKWYHFGKRKADYKPDDKDKQEFNTKRDTANSEYSRKNAFVVSLVHEESSITTQTIGVILNAYKDRNRQARAICVKAIAKSGNFTEESAVFEYPEYGTSFLSDIEFK